MEYAFIVRLRLELTGPILGYSQLRQDSKWKKTVQSTSFRKQDY